MTAPYILSVVGYRNGGQYCNYRNNDHYLY